MSITRQITIRGSRDVAMTRIQVWAMDQGCRSLREDFDSLEFRYERPAALRSAGEGEGAAWNLRVTLEDGDPVTMRVVADPCVFGVAVEGGPEAKPTDASPRAMMEDLCQFVASEGSIHRAPPGTASGSEDRPE